MKNNIRPKGTSFLLPVTVFVDVVVVLPETTSGRESPFVPANMFIRGPSEHSIGSFLLTIAEILPFVDNPLSCEERLAREGIPPTVNPPHKLLTNANNTNSTEPICISE